MPTPFQIVLYDRNFARVGYLNDPVSLEVNVRHNAIGTATVVIPNSHRQLGHLAATGARMVITYYDEFVMSGYVFTIAGTGPSTEGQTTITCQDDLWLVWRMLGWPVPTATIDAQGVKKDSRTGPAEDVAKGFLADNAAHLIDDITVAPSLHRGASITVASRMAVLGEILMDPVDKAGIGLTVRQSGTGLLVDAYAPKVYPHVLSEQAGTVVNWDWSRAIPSSTRVIIGGPNVDTSREFREVVRPAYETALQYSIETFVDAGDAENYVHMDEAGNKALDAAGPTSGFKLELSETQAFHYGGTDGVHVGDQVSVDLGGQVFTDVLREADLSWKVEDGLKISPTVGERTDDPDVVLAKKLAALSKGVRDLRTR